MANQNQNIIRIMDSIIQCCSEWIPAEEWTAETDEDNEKTRVYRQLREFLDTQSYDFYQYSNEFKSIKNTIPNEFDLEDKEKFLYLKPFKDGENWYFPILGVEYTSPVDEYRFLLGVFTLNQDDKPKGIGFRFEFDGDGRHDYEHAQLISRFSQRKKTRWRIGRSWYPTEKIAFPIDADTPTEFFLALLRSMYSSKEIARMLGKKDWEFVYEDNLENWRNKYLWGSREELNEML